MIRALVTVILIFITFAAGARDQQLLFFTVGSGDVTGGYFSAAQAICTTINYAENGKVHCSPDPSSGSLYNLSMLKKGELDFALVQSDWHRYAYEGKDIFSGQAAMTGLRSVMGLYPEAITIIVSAESGINSLADLIGKRIDMGFPSSGRFASITRLFELLDIESSDFKGVFGFTQGRAIDELCANHIDATVLIVGHPNSNVSRAMSECGAKMISFDGPVIETSLGAATDYQKAVVTSTTYPALESDIISYAVYSTIVTRADVAPELVDIFVTQTLENLENLSMESDILAGLTVEGLRTNGLTAPLHPGAEQAFNAISAKVAAETPNKSVNEKGGTTFSDSPPENAAPVQQTEAQPAPTEQQQRDAMEREKLIEEQAGGPGASNAARAQEHAEQAPHEIPEAVEPVQTYNHGYNQGNPQLQRPIVPPLPGRPVQLPARPVQRQVR